MLNDMQIISQRNFHKKMVEYEKLEDAMTKRYLMDALMAETLCELGYGEGIEVYDESGFPEHMPIVIDTEDEESKISKYDVIRDTVLIIVSMLWGILCYKFFIWFS